LHFLTAIRGLVRGRCQGRNWWLQATFGVPGNATKLERQIKFSERDKALVFKDKTRSFSFPKRF
jgi:hypothetical protein